MYIIQASGTFEEGTGVCIFSLPITLYVQQLMSKFLQDWDGVDFLVTEDQLLLCTVFCWHLEHKGSIWKKPADSSSEHRVFSATMKQEQQGVRGKTRHSCNGRAKILMVACNCTWLTSWFCHSIKYAWCHLIKTFHQSSKILSPGYLWS